jgi:hypothetical protein
VKRKVNKSSITGKFVSDEEVETNPGETYSQTVEVPEREKPSADAEHEKGAQSDCWDVQ